jgi:hypothetical protein
MKHLTCGLPSAWELIAGQRVAITTSPRTRLPKAELTIVIPGSPLVLQPSRQGTKNKSLMFVPGIAFYLVFHFSFQILKLFFLNFNDFN